MAPDHYFSDTTIIFIRQSYCNIHVETMVLCAVTPAQRTDGRHKSARLNLFLWEKRDAYCLAIAVKQSPHRGSAQCNADSFMFSVIASMDATTNESTPLQAFPQVAYEMADETGEMVRLAVQGYPRDNGHTDFASFHGVRYWRQWALP